MLLQLQRIPGTMESPGAPDDTDPEDPQKRMRELEQVNEEYAELVQLLLEQIEGKKEESYSYSFQSGWKEKEQDSTREELASEDLDAQLREIRQLKERYR